MKYFLFLMFGVGAVACSSSTTGSGATSGPQQASLDTADAVAKAAARCGQDYNANYNAFIANAAKGNCANVTQIRDEVSLRKTCIPSLSAVACADLLALHIDATCGSQLVHPAAWAPSLTPARFEGIGAEE
jgi:hypothetical protein